MPTASRLATLVFVIAISTSQSASGQLTADWAKSMFDKQKIDFGVIARGSDARQTVNITNNSRNTVHIASVRTTCGCSAAKPSQQLLNPGETSVVEVTMDTRKFTRRKDSNVIVTFDQPAITSVTVPITSYIRTDVVVTPGSVVFGAVEDGKGAKKTIDIAYAGRNEWKIREVKSSSKSIKVAARETARANGRVGYALDVELLPTAAAGNIQHVITLVTDDANNPYVPILVSGSVESDIVVTPHVVQFGVAAIGKEVTKRVIIRGRDQIEISGIEVESENEDFKVRMPKGKKNLHILQLTFVPPERTGKWTEEFVLTIAGRPEPVRFKAAGEVRK